MAYIPNADGSAHDRVKEEGRDELQLERDELLIARTKQRRLTSRILELERNERGAREAIRNLLTTSSTRGAFKTALAARDAASKAYLLLFSEAEKAKVIEVANQRPDGDYIETFADAVKAYGWALIDEALGS